ncbi:hypothetical protein FGD77_02350 [Roseovarius sp. M141]|nr:hypothetical protein [Roseovarius sp. M141]
MICAVESLFVRDGITVGSGTPSHLLEVSMHALRIEARKVKNQLKIPARIMSNPSSGELSVLSFMFAPRLQIGEDGEQDMLPQSML